MLSLVKSKIGKNAWSKRQNHSHETLTQKKKKEKNPESREEMKKTWEEERSSNNYCQLEDLGGGVAGGGVEEITPCWLLLTAPFHSAEQRWAQHGW